MLTHCELCGMQMDSMQVPAHQQSKGCERVRVEYEMRRRDLVPCSQTWSTLQRAGLALVRARAPDKRLYAPAWAVYTAQALAPPSAWQGHARRQGAHRASPTAEEDATELDYTGATQRRHQVVEAVQGAGPEVQQAVVSAWTLGGLPAAKRLLEHLAEDRGWL